jgi:hypothetical protein
MATHKQLLTALGAWSAVSIVGGTALMTRGRTRFARNFGRQTAAWGAVNAAIAGFGATRPAPDVSRLRKVLLINCLADLGYMGLGVAAVRNGYRGDGEAVVVQGAFLLALDSHFAYRLAD